jgi:transcriptional regulator with XRE-family HTH domain
MAEQPDWARRIRALREARGYSQAEAAEVMRTHSDRTLPDAEHLVRRWKAWELGENKPSREYATLIAATLGTVTDSLFPPQSRAADLSLLSATGMDTLEIVGRLQVSDVTDATIEALQITVDKLCSEYAYTPPRDLIVEGRQWLRRIVDMQERHLTFRQRRRTLELAGWLALLVGCLEYDLGDRRAAEATRRMALKLGTEIENPGILGWSHEMQAWFALTRGDYRGVLAAAEAGQAAASNHSVQVQLIAQEAKALARMGQTAEMEMALERGRQVLDRMPYPDNIQNHFVVDPAKFDFYAMDCYRHVGNDRIARTLAEEVLRNGRSDFNGTDHTPMRSAEAQITLAVAAAREGELSEAIHYGQLAISGDRKSVPSLLMVSRDLTSVLAERYASEPEANEYRERLQAIARTIS